MTPEVARHFKPAHYARYNSSGDFAVTEGRDVRSVTLWHNRTQSTPLNEQPRFFEEDSPFYNPRIPDNNMMTRDNYHNLLHELNIPVRGEPEAYVREETIFTARPPHRIIVEKLVTPADEVHTRIRRQIVTLEGDEVVLGGYDQVVDRLDKAGLIYAVDFTHWVPQPPLGAEQELRTRINSPRK